MSTLLGVLQISPYIYKDMLYYYRLVAKCSNNSNSGVAAGARNAACRWLQQYNFVIVRRVALRSPLFGRL